MFDFIFVVLVNFIVFIVRLWILVKVVDKFRLSGRLKIYYYGN